MGLIKVISHGNQRNPGMINLIRSLRKWGYDYKIIAIGEKQEGWRDKLKRYSQELEKYKPKQIVCCVDCQEILATGPPENLYYRFLRYNKPIVFGTESMQGINGMILNNWWNHQNIETIRRPLNQYLNTRTFIGRVENIKHCLRYAINSHFENPQLALSAYTEAFPRNVHLDTESSLFGTITSMDLSYFRNRSGKVIDTRTLRKPCMINIYLKEADLMLRMNHFGRMILGKDYVPTSLLETIPTVIKKLLQPNNRHKLMKTIEFLLMFMISVIQRPRTLLIAPFPIVLYFFMLQ